MLNASSILHRLFEHDKPGEEQGWNSLENVLPPPSVEFHMMSASVNKGELGSSFATWKC